jgi:dTDP-4-dehydrorhamnose reductase
MKILLTGNTGQLGFELARAVACLGDVIAVGRSQCDLANPAEVRDLVRRVAPDVILNPAAYTAVDRAETDQEAAILVNTDAPKIFGEEADRLGALVIHYSTDYVFDGTVQGAYSEQDQTNPQSVYGRSKLDGELALALATNRHLILRTSWIVGAFGGNFAKTILRLAAERESLSIVADQFGAPTSAALLADLTAHLIAQHKRQRSSFQYGTYHVTASGHTTWYEYARFVISQAQTAGHVLKADSSQIRPISTDRYPTPAKRPANSRLDTTRFRETFGLRLPHWEEGVRQVLTHIL